MKVAVLYGGHSAEREVSLRSGTAVYQALQSAGYEVCQFDPSDADISVLRTMNIDKAFIMLHGRGGEDGAIQGALETLGIKYTGSGIQASAIGMDKLKSKLIWQALQLPTEPFVVVDKALDEHQAKQILLELGGTVMVKPVQEGSSIGMAKVSSVAALVSAVTQAQQFDQQVLIEKYIVGSEYTVAVLQDQALPSIGLLTEHDFYDFSAKYQSGDTIYQCPSDLTDAEEKQIGQLALAAFKAIGCRGWGRVDIMRHQDGAFSLLEINTVPGMTETSLVPKAAAQAGISFVDLVSRIVDLA